MRDVTQTNAVVCSVIQISAIRTSITKRQMSLSVYSIPLMQVDIVGSAHRCELGRGVLQHLHQVLSK